MAPLAALHALSGGSATDIFPGSPGNGVRGDARALNNSGQVTGAAIGLPPTTADARPYRWDPGTPAPAVQIGGGLAGTAWGAGINAAGVVAGTTQNGAGGIRAFRAVANAIVILDPLPGTTASGGFTSAAAINDANQIVGTAASATSGPHAVLWNASNQIQDLGTLGGSFSAATYISGFGEIIGTSALPGDATVHWFIWTGVAPMHDLSLLLGFTPTAVAGINTPGEIAGTFVNSSGEDHAFLYTTNGVRDLGTLGGTSSSATGINNASQVVGVSTTATGASHAFLWTPAGGMEDITAVTGIASVHGLNDILQTLTGSADFATDPTPPKLVQLAVPNPNYPPYAYFTVHCPTLQCTFDASASSDDAGIVRYTWDWGNGRSESHASPVARHTFPAAGIYTVTLTVTDAQGLTSTLPLQFTVPTPMVNQPPSALLRPVDCTGQQYPHQCAFDATPSSDDVGIVSYAWLWGDGRRETHTRPTVRNTWARAGTFLVTLIVTDSGGLTSSTQVSVSVP